MNRFVRDFTIKLNKKEVLIVECHFNKTLFLVKERQNVRLNKEELNVSFVLLLLFPTSDSLYDTFVLFPTTDSLYDTFVLFPTTDTLYDTFVFVSHY